MRLIAGGPSNLPGRGGIVLHRYGDINHRKCLAILVYLTISGEAVSEAILKGRSGGKIEVMLTASSSAGQ